LSDSGWITESENQIYESRPGAAGFPRLGLGVKSKKKRLAASLLQEEAVVIQAWSRRFFWLIAA
jgi:hypothetical protein